VHDRYLSTPPDPTCPDDTSAPSEDGDDWSWVGIHEQPTMRALEDPVGPRLGTRQPLVLVVDDNRDNRDFYVEYLLHLGCRVLAASNGLEGLRLARLSLPDLIVLDISMPVMDGCEMAQRVRNDDRTYRTPMLAVTCFGSAWQEAALACGCQKVLPKPAELDAFEAAVVDLLGDAPAGA